jgi:hypothetical protein
MNYLVFILPPHTFCSYKLEPSEETGGTMWPDLYQRVLVGFWLAILVLIGVTSLKQGVITVGVLLPLLVIIPLLGNESLVYCRNASASLPLYDASKADTLPGRLPVEDVLRDVPTYQQPFLRQTVARESKNEALKNEALLHTHGKREGSNL